MAPPSPIPLAPPGNGDGVTTWPYSIRGASAAVGQQVVQERGRQRVAVGVVDEMLVERAADALHDSAGDLPFDHHRIDHHAAVLAHDVAQDADLARARVDLDRAGVAGVGESERRRGEAGRHLQALLRLRRQRGMAEQRQIGELRRR